MKLLSKFVLLLFAITCLSACGNGSSKTNKPQTEDVTKGVTDYSKAENWLSAGNGNKFNVDVFYLYPTSWIPTEQDGVFCALDNASMRKNVPVVYSSQAKVFEDIANVYAPWYRQADARKLLGISNQEVDTYLKKVPLRDAIAAFEYYLQHYNQGRPFILAGHSQGSAVLKLILKDYMKEHPDVLKRMIVAYPLGYSYEDSYFKNNPHLKFAKGETDTGVIVCWNCERKENDQFAKVNNVCFTGALSINPVSWKRDYEKVEAGDARYLGSKPRPGISCSVQVQYDSIRQHEVVILGIDTDKWDTKIIGDHNLHGFDFSLFTENVKANALKRIETYFGNN